MARQLSLYVLAGALAAVLLGGCAKSDQTTSSAAGVTNRSTLGDRARGEQVFAANCAACHGADASGGVGPSLTGENHRKNYEATVAWIEAPDPPMPKLYPAPLSEKDVEDVATFVQSL